MWMLHHDKAPAHASFLICEFLTKHESTVVPLPPYSPVPALSDYHLFSGLKKQLKSCHFSSDTEVIDAVETWLDGQPSEFFFYWLAKVRATG